MPTLLLADDSVTIQRVVEMTFAAQDVTVIPVSDGEQAIGRIEEEPPDIVLADIAMPKKNGYEVAAFVKSRPDLAHIPVLLLAGAFEPVDQARAQQVRCDGVLVKPFEPQQVIARVRELLGGVRGAALHEMPGVPRPVERLTSLKLVDLRRPALPPTEPPVPPAAAMPPPVAVPNRPIALPSPVPPAGSGGPARHADSGVQADFTAPPDTTAWPEVSSVESRLAAETADAALDDYFDRLDDAFASLSSSPATQANPAAPTSTTQLPAPMPAESAHPPVFVAPPASRLPAPPGRAAEPTPTQEAEEGEIPTLDALLGLLEASNAEPASRAVRMSPPAPASVPVGATPAQPMALPVLEPPDASPTLTADPAPPVQEPAAVPPEEGHENRDAIADAFSALLAAELGAPETPVAPSRTPAAVKTPAGPPEVSDALVEEVTRRVLQRLAPDAMRDLVADVVSDIAERLVREEITRIRQN